MLVFDQLKKNDPQVRVVTLVVLMGLGVLLGFPVLELLEQSLPVGVRLYFGCGRALFQERLEFVARDRLDAVPVEPLLGGRQAIPAGKRRGQ